MSQPIFTDKQLQSLSLDELKKIVSQEKKDLRKDYKILQKKRILIEKYQKMRNIRPSETDFDVRFSIIYNRQGPVVRRPISA